MAYWTPNFRITTEYNGLPNGASVRVVDDGYVPEETKAKFGKYFSSWESPKDYAWCYTGRGFMLIPWRIIKES